MIDAEERVAETGAEAHQQRAPHKKYRATMAQGFQFYYPTIREVLREVFYPPRGRERETSYTRAETTPCYGLNCSRHSSGGAVTLGGTAGYRPRVLSEVRYEGILRPPIPAHDKSGSTVVHG